MAGGDQHHRIGGGDVPDGDVEGAGEEQPHPHLLGHGKRFAAQAGDHEHGGDRYPQTDGAEAPRPEIAQGDGDDDPVEAPD
jgi:hypothetical protein